MKIGFRVDFGGTVGFGHFSRSASLAKAFQRAGHEVVFFSRGPREAYQNAVFKGLRSEDLEVVPMDPSLSDLSSGVPLDIDFSHLDALETKKLFSKHRAETLIVDSYSLSNLWVHHWGRHAALMSISDTSAPDGVETVLDYGFDAVNSKHAVEPGDNRRGLFGPDFALVSSGFSKFKDLPTNDSFSSGLGLVSLGGAATSSLWSMVIKSVLKAFETSEFLLPDSQTLQQVMTQNSDGRVILRGQFRGLDDFFEQADFAIVNAGVTMYELLASGKPGIALVTADNQRPAFHAKKRAVTVNGGELGALDEAVSGLRQEILSSSSSPILTWLKSRSVVDHSGPDRVVIALGMGSKQRHLLREAGPLDLPFLLRLVNQPSTREASFKQSVVLPADHLTWFKSSPDTERRIWIYEVSGVSVGHCRLDNREGAWELDYSILEIFQGMGHATDMMRLLLMEARQLNHLVAFVKPGNLGSIAVLKRVGFSVSSTTPVSIKLDWRVRI